MTHHVVVLSTEDHAALMSGEMVELTTEDGYEVTVAGDLLSSAERGLLRQPGQQVAVRGDGREVVLDTRLLEDVWTDELFTIRLSDGGRRLLMDGETVELEAEGGETFAVDGSELPDRARAALRRGGIARVAQAEDLLALDASELEPLY